MTRLLACLSLLLVAVSVPSARADTTSGSGVELVPLASVPGAIDLAFAPGDSQRMFAVLQAGRIKVVENGTVRSDSFLEVPDLATSAGEQGLLSMAFAPDYQSSGRFYVFYTENACDGANCDLRVDEFRRSDANHADVTTRRKILSIPHRDFDHHNGGRLQFGPDGRLYLSTGDGGGVNDPGCNSQDTSSRLGKILRIDPGPPTIEVFAYGLRNPFRFSFDRATGDLLIGDVGELAQEEVDLVTPAAAAGANFGWNVFEGSAPHSTSCAASAPGYVPPALTYSQPTPRAVTGGVVVRDLALPALLGRYVYGDFFAGQIHHVALAQSSSSGDALTGLQVNHLAAFTDDAACRVHVLSADGPIYRLQAANSTTTAAGCQPPPSPGATLAAGAGPIAGGAPPPPLLDRTRPALTHLALLRRRFAVAGVPTALVAGRPRVARGTAFRYTLSELSTVTVRFHRALPGRRSRGRCVAPSRRLLRAPRCRRYLARGTLVRRNLRAGRVSTAFSGRVGRRALAPGRYRATLRARDGAGNLSAIRTAFLQVVRP